MSWSEPPGATPGRYLPAVSPEPLSSLLAPMALGFAAGAATAVLVVLASLSTAFAAVDAGGSAGVVLAVGLAVAGLSAPTVAAVLVALGARRRRTSRATAGRAVTMVVAATVLVMLPFGVAHPLSVQAAVAVVVLGLGFLVARFAGVRLLG
jgi:hypothetical protein